MTKPFSVAGSGTTGAPDTVTTACTVFSPAFVSVSGCCRSLGGKLRLSTPCAFWPPTSSKMVCVLRQRARRQHHPCILLRRRIRGEIARSLDAFDRAGDGRARRAPLGGKRHQGRRIAQRRAIVAAAVVEHRTRRDRRKRRGIDAFGTRAIAEHSERGGDLRLGDRGGKCVEFGI